MKRRSFFPAIFACGLFPCLRPPHEQSQVAEIDWAVIRYGAGCNAGIVEYYVEGEHGWPLLVASNTGQWFVKSYDLKECYQGVTTGLEAAKAAVVECCREHKLYAFAEGKWPPNKEAERRARIRSAIIKGQQLTSRKETNHGNNRTTICNGQ